MGLSVEVPSFCRAFVELKEILYCKVSWGRDRVSLLCGALDSHKLHCSERICAVPKELRGFILHVRNWRQW